MLRTGLTMLCGCLAVFVLPLAQARTADPGHRFACADYSQDKVFIVAADGRIEWEHAAPGCDELTVLPNGHLLFTTRTGVLEVTPAKKVVWSYADHRAMRAVASVQVLDIPAEGELLH